jgi:hypothetical protein
LPSAVRVRLGKCAIVRFRFAAAAAFFTFLRAAARCFLLAIPIVNRGSGEERMLQSDFR